MNPELPILRTLLTDSPTCLATGTERRKNVKMRFTNITTVTFESQYPFVALLLPTCDPFMNQLVANSRPTCDQPVTCL